MSESLYLSQTDHNISYSRDNILFTVITGWPFNLRPSDTNNALNVFFNTDITISSNIFGTTANGTDVYFVCGNNNITIGNNTGPQTNVLIDGVTSGYYGFIKNGTYSNGTFIDQKDNVTVQNIKINISTDSILNENNYFGSGWLCQTFFGHGKFKDSPPNYPSCSIVNCSSYADTTVNNTNYLSGLGGIVGNWSTVYALNCTFDANLINISSGGILGANCYNCVAENCICGHTGSMPHDTGNNCGGIYGYGSSGSTALNCINYNKLVGEYSGGIFGSNTNYTSSNSSYAYNCKNYGDIGSDAVGGIYGSGAINSYASNCYNTGNMLAGSFGSGGIFGSGSSNSTASNCYNIGNLVNPPPPNPYGFGGIFANACSSCTANHCYNTGNISDYSGGIFGSSCSASTASYCYSAGTTGATDNLGGIFGSTSNGCTASYCYITNFSFGQYFGATANGDIAPAFDNCKFSVSWDDTKTTDTIGKTNWISISLNTPYLLTTFNNNFYNGAISGTIYSNNYTSLSLTDNGDFFYIVPTSNSSNLNISNTINLNFGQMTSSVIDNYIFYVLRTYPHMTNINSSIMYGYNIIQFNLNVIANINPNNINVNQNNSILYSLVTTKAKKYVKKNIVKLLKYK